MSVAFRNRNAQRGIGLILLLVVVVLAFTYVLMSRLPLATQQTAAKREYNAKVLNQAKQALIGWMAVKAAQTDDNPGRLPCPEGAGNIGTDQEGISAPTFLPPPWQNCATVGRLPWRTVGLDKLVDADAEPLWYAVSPGWALQTSTTKLTINSDSRGQMTVDGQAAPNDVVALIIAPGRAMSVQAVPGCTARNQARSAPAPTINPADYIECFNAATPAFSTVGPAASFNDQVLAVTTADLIPQLEAAIQQRMQREIAPALRTVYSSAAWGRPRPTRSIPLPRASTIPIQVRPAVTPAKMAATRACFPSVAPRPVAPRIRVWRRPSSTGVAAGDRPRFREARCLEGRAAISPGTWRSAPERLSA